MWTSHKIAAGVEISSPRAWGRVWLPRTARRHQCLRQGLSQPARSVQRGPGARSAAHSELGRGQRSPASGAARGERPGQHVRPGRGGRNRSSRAGAVRGPAASAASDGRPAPRKMNGPRSAASRIRVWRPGSKTAAGGGGGSWGPSRAGSRLPLFLSHPTPPGAPWTAASPGRPTAVCLPQLLAVRPRNSPLVGL